MRGVKLLALPFRFNQFQPGSFAKVEQGSDAQKAQEISSFILTHKRERPLYQDYGIDDPSFNLLDETELAADFAMFYGESDIELESIAVVAEQQGETKVSVKFN